MEADAWLKIYAYLLHLYPRRFRVAFGPEMCEVFVDVLADARRQGFRSMLRFGLREFGELPFHAIREHASPLIDSFVTTFSRHPVWGAVLGYALGFLLLRLPQALIPIWPFMTVFWDVTPLRYLLFFLSGWLGGSMLGLSIRRGGSHWFGLLGGLSQLVSYLVISQLYFLLFHDGLNRPPVGWLNLMIIFTWPMLNGLFIGTIMGSFRENWKYILRFAGFGASGFLLAYLGNRLAAALIQSYLLNPTYNPLPSLTGLWQGLFIIIPQLIYGALIGASLGLANRKPRLLRTRLAI